MFDWIYKRIFSPKNVGRMIKNAEPYIQGQMDAYLKNSVINLINDPEVGQYILVLGDGLYNRYMQKFTGLIGGTQKGINAQVNRTMDELNPFSDIIGEDGDGNLTFNLMGAVKTFLTGGFKGMGGGGASRPSSPNTGGGIPPMRRLSER